MRKREHYIGLFQLTSNFKERFVQRRLDDLLQNGEIEIELNEDGEFSEIISVLKGRDMSLEEAIAHIDMSEQDPVISSDSLVSMKECADHYLSGGRKNPGVLIHRLILYIKHLEHANKSLQQTLEDSRC